MRIAIVTFPGTTGEKDILEALIAVGFPEEKVTLVDEKQEDLSQFEAVFLPGGTSYGDSVRPGAVAKVAPVSRAIVRFAEEEKPVVGIGNGFQILTELGLLPGGFLKNSQLRAVNGFVEVTVTNTETSLTNKCVLNGILKLPVAHKYGQYTADAEVLGRLKENGQIVLQYQNENPNGSSLGIAGIRNEAGNVVGLMPKPERAMEKVLGSDAGRMLFESFFAHMNLR